MVGMKVYVTDFGVGWMVLPTAGWDGVLSYSWRVDVAAVLVVAEVWWG